MLKYVSRSANRTWFERPEGMPEALHRLLIERGIASAEEAERFLRMADSLIRAGQKDAELRMRRQELELKAAAQQTKDAQLKLAREKFEAAERRENAARNALGDTKLTDAAKIAKMKEIFG